MRNADLLPFVPSQMFCNHDQMQNVDIFATTDNKILSVHNPSFCMEPQFLNNTSNQLIRDGSFAIPFESDYHQFPYSETTQQPMLLDKIIPLSHIDLDFKAASQTRKRPIEFPHMLQTTGANNRIDHNEANLNEWKRNKRKKSTSFGQQRQNPDTESINLQDYIAQVPTRRSQKISDKITALQKLVSPYGKTDTASVLQEASLYIKLVQEQIQNLFQMLSILHSSDLGGDTMNLRSRGFCLVPKSFSEKITIEQEQEHVDEIEEGSRDYFLV